MLFTRTQRYHSAISQEDFINQLTGSHVSIHNLDFEIIAKKDSLTIIPHAEQVDAIKTLPITKVNLKKTGNETDVIVTSKMRRLDSGGPLLVMIFCIFLLLTSFVVLYVNEQPQITYTMVGISILIFAVFFIRMEMGYFDYVRKIQAYVKSKLEFTELAR
jgi:hypothetical protein